MLLSNKVTGSVRGQYRHEVQPIHTEMDRDFVESKGSTNLGYSDAILLDFGSEVPLRSKINAAFGFCIGFSFGVF